VSLGHRGQVEKIAKAQKKVSRIGHVELMRILKQVRKLDISIR